MKYLAWIFAGLLLAAIVQVATTPAGERVGILRVAPAPQAPPRPAPAATNDAVAFGGAVAPGTARPTETATSLSSAAVRGSAWPRDTGTAPPAPAAPLPSGLVVPVQGVAPSQLSPTFEDARGEGRVHEALDIMAPAGTPVLAVADGHVEKLFDSDQGGLTIYQFEPAGRHAYYYAHLERYAPGLAEGQQIRQGHVIGYVGSTGNADPSAPHLHFAIFVLGPEKQWWEGTPIDPYPLLAAPR